MPALALTKEQARVALTNSISCMEDVPRYREGFIIREKDLLNPHKIAGIANPLFTTQALFSILKAYGINPYAHAHSQPPQ